MVSVRQICGLKPRFITGASVVAHPELGSIVDLHSPSRVVTMNAVNADECNWRPWTSYELKYSPTIYDTPSKRKTNPLPFESLRGYQDVPLYISPNSLIFHPELNKNATELPSTMTEASVAIRKRKKSEGEVKGLNKEESRKKVGHTDLDNDLYLDRSR